VPGSDENGVDRVAACAGQMIAFQKAVAFRVADHGFDGAAPSQLAFDRLGSRRLALRHVDVGGRQAMTAIALVDIGARNRDARQAFDLRDLILQGVPVVGKPRRRADAENELAAVGACVGDGDRSLDAKFVARARLPLRDAFNLGRVQGVAFAPGTL